MIVKTERLHIIDIVKGVTIIFVVLSHYGWQSTQTTKMLFPFWIGMAVPTFMIVSGYVNSLSCEAKKIKTISEMYNYKNIIAKALRYTIPFSIAYIVEVCFQLKTEELSIKDLVGIFFIGGIGPGSYFYPVIMQFIFVFPIIYYVIKKYDFFGLINCFICNFVYEFLKCIYGMPSSEYRLLIYRYVGLIAFGCYLGVGKKKISKKIKIVSLIAGILWLFLINYTNYEPTIINKEWAGTSFVSAFYAMPVFEYLIKKYKNSRNCFLEIVGKASFNVFLTQMVYFSYAEYAIERIINNVFLINLANVLICVSIGLIFYLLESKVTKKLIDILRTNNFFENKTIKTYRTLINKIQQ